MIDGRKGRAPGTKLLKFSPARYRALQEVSEERVMYWLGDYPDEPMDNWLVDGARVNQQAYNWLREKSLIAPDPPPPRKQLHGGTRMVRLTPRGEAALTREHEKAARREADAEAHAAKTEAARQANEEKKNGRR